MFQVLDDARFILKNYFNAHERKALKLKYFDCLLDKLNRTMSLSQKH